MIAINLEPELEKNAIDLAQRKGVSLEVFVREAIERMIEELQDIALLEETLKTHDPAKNISMDQMRRELGLDA
ncbi:MAG: DNA-binding protein [Novosphingobium sp.]|jgi:predicted DNA-binding protein|nr:DNA-binding protein [Novosphingobium sp.]